jgi:outer membrane cobalamin receptor
MSFGIKHCLIIICTLCLSLEAQGQIFTDSTQTKTIPQVTVTGDRTQNARSVATSKQADATLMQAAGSLQISDVIKYFSGATVKDYGGIGGLKTVSVRGLGAQHTAVAYDGIIITDNQTGQIDLGKFSASQARSVRMVSGPDNDLLQPASLAAQAAVITLNASRPQLGNAAVRSWSEAKLGSFGTWSVLGGSDFRAGPDNTISLQAEWLKSRGDYPYIQEGAGSRNMTRDNSDIQRLRLEAALFSDLTENTTLTTRAYWFQSEQGLPANIYYNDTPARERLWNRNGFIQSTLSQNVTDRLTLRINAKYGITHTRYLDPDANTIQGKTDNRYTEQEGYLSGVVLYRIRERISASAGIDGRLSGLDGNGTQMAAPTRITLNSTAAVKYASDRLTVTGRINHVITSEKTKLRKAAESYNHLSPTIGLNWLAWPSAGLHIRASHSNTFRLPTFNDLYFEQIGRRDLRPEQARVTSAGVTLDNQYGTLHYSFYADIYNSDVKDRIMAVPDGNTVKWKMVNLGRVLTHGIETGLDISRTAGLIRPAARISYTYQRAMDKSDSGSSVWNHQIAYTPRHSASAVAWIETPMVNVSCNIIYSGEFFSNGYNGPEFRMPHYYETGCSAWREFELDGFTATIKAECINLTDYRYEFVHNYPMPGRQFRITARIEL